MAEIRLPTVHWLKPEASVTWIADDTPLVSKEYHDALVADLTALHQHDMDWARRFCAARGIDLDDLADRDPTYRAEFRA